MARDLSVSSQKSRLQRIKNGFYKFFIWLFPDLTFLVTTLLYLVPCLLYFGVWNTNENPPEPANIVLMWSCGFLLILIDRLQFRKYGENVPAKAGIALLLLRAVLMAVMTNLDGSDFSPYLYLVLPFYAVIYLNLSVSWLIFGLVMIARVVVYFIYDDPNWYSKLDEIKDFVVYIIGVIFTMVVGMAIVGERTARRQADKLRAEAQELSAEKMRQAAEIEVLKERNSIARRIHDNLGNALIGVDAQLKKAVAYRTIDVNEVEQAVDYAAQQTTLAIKDLRLVVSTLRNTRQNQTLFSLIAALRELQRSNLTFHLKLEISGEENEVLFADNLLKDLYQIVREALTNVQKHAQAKTVIIRLNFSRSNLLLEILDDGVGFEVAQLQVVQAQLQTEMVGGYGLQGIQESIEHHAGNLKIKSSPGQGTKLRIELALKQ